MNTPLRDAALSTPNLPLSTLNNFPRSPSHVVHRTPAPPFTADDVELQPLFERVQTRTASLGPTPAPEINTPWRKALYDLLEQPSSSPSAFIIHFLSTFLIIFSACLTVLETLPVFHKTPTSVWFGMETTLVMLFTVEYIARFVAHSESLSMLFSWSTSFLPIVDLLAIVPYYVEIALQADTTSIFRWSILRTFRLLRMFRAFSHSNTILLTIEVMYISIQRSADALLALSFFVVMLLVVFSTLLYFAERGTWDPTLEQFVNANGDVSQFSSIPASAWFVITTITTVGYGEIIPRSVLGRLITVPLLMFGLLVVALPSFVLGRNFSVVWEAMRRKAEQSERARNEEMEYERVGNGVAEPESDSAAVEVLKADVRRLTKAVEKQGGDLERLIQLLEGRNAREE